MNFTGRLDIPKLVYYSSNTASTMNKFIEFLKYTKTYELFFKVLQILNVSHPQFLKQRIIKTYTKKYNLQILIETGTYLGTTVDATKNVFLKIYSIELDRRLYQRAKNKFSKFKNIQIIQGDSSIILPKLLKKIKVPCLFWLDAHFSKGITARGRKDTPIWEELTAILNHKIKNHLILIDDADSFSGKNDYPSILQVKKIVLKKGNYYLLRIKDNIIILTPKHLPPKADK